jgi:prepilin-type N-terminal cleavage/methylation domain-containing protein
VTAGLGRGRLAAVVGRCKRRHAPDERGFSLLEVLIAIVIMSTVMVALMGALFTMTTASSLEQRTTAVGAELRRYADAVRNTEYVACADSDNIPVTYNAPPNYTAPTGWTAEVKTIKLWEAPHAPDLTTTSDLPASDTDPNWVSSRTLYNDTKPNASADPWKNRDDCDTSGTTSAGVWDDGLQLITVSVTDNGSLPITLTQTIRKRCTIECTVPDQ